MIKKVSCLILSLIIVISSFYAIYWYQTNNINSNTNSKNEEVEKLSKIKNESKIIEMIKKVNKENVTKYLKEIDEFGPKLSGSEACEDTAIYLYNKFESFGLDVEYQDWKFPFRKGKNVVATKYASNPENDDIFIVSAHYDTWKGAPGANDDGSGIDAMLIIAEITSRYTFNNTIKFVAFSGHEVGPSYAYGSSAYAKKAYEENENIIGVLNLDMIGNTTETGNAVQLHGATRSKWLLDFIEDTNEEYSQYFDIIIESFYSTPGADETSFIDYGYDAVLFIQSNYWEPPNHCPEDDLSTINFDFLTNLTKLILAVTVELADMLVEIQIQIVEPYEGYVYIFDKPFLKLPGFNLRKFGLRGMTYILGGRITINTDIDTDDEIKCVYFILDDEATYKKVVSNPPYEFKIKKHTRDNLWLRGKHKIGVRVITHSGKTAFDEMDLFFLP